MSLQIVTADGSSFRLREYQPSPLAPAEVRVRVEFAAPKHGTEGHSWRGSAFDRKRWDPALRMFFAKEPPEGPPAPPSERAVGNMVVGTVSEVGPEVTRWRTGDRVFGYGPIQEVAQAQEEQWHALGTLEPADAVCVDPAHVALVAVRDGSVRIGDTVAVFGMGAIGLMAAQIARAGGARKVFVVDPLAMRRDCALARGADAAFDPTACDAALEIKRATDGHGVDVSIETSGSGRALHEAIRCLRQCGTVVHVPWGPHDCSALHLDEEFHLNRPTIVGSQAWSGWGNADRGYPLWTHERAYEATIELFRAGLATGEGIVTPMVSFSEAPAALAEAFAHPDGAIKVGVLFA